MSPAIDNLTIQTDNSPPHTHKRLFVGCLSMYQFEQQILDLILNTKKYPPRIVIDPRHIEHPAYRYIITKPWCSQGLELYEALKFRQCSSQMIINEELDEVYAFNEIALAFMAQLPALCKHIVHYTLIYLPPGDTTYSPETIAFYDDFDKPNVVIDTGIDYLLSLNKIVFPYSANKPDQSDQSEPWTLIPLKKSSTHPPQFSKTLVIPSDPLYHSFYYDDKDILEILTDNKKYKPNITILKTHSYNKNVRFLNNDTLSIDIKRLVFLIDSKQIDFWPNHIHEKSDYPLDIDLLKALSKKAQYRDKVIEYNLLRLT